MRHLNDTVASYLATWNETDPARRRALAARAVTEDSSYVDPLAAVEGIEGLDAVIAAAQQQFAGLRFELDAGPEAHHDRVRFRWRLVAPAGGEPLAVGTDVATVAADGRLRQITGFLDVLPG